MEEIFGTLTLILAVTMTFLALPSQIRKNYKDKECGLSALMVFLPLLVYLSRAVYAVDIKSYYILIPDIFGIIFASVILWQYIKYKKAGTIMVKSIQSPLKLINGEKYLLIYVSEQNGQVVLKHFDERDRESIGIFPINIFDFDSSSRALNIGALYTAKQFITKQICLVKSIQG